MLKFSARFLSCSATLRRGITGTISRYGTQNEHPSDLFANSFNLTPALTDHHLLSSRLYDPKKEIKDIPINPVIIENPRSSMLTDIEDMIKNIKIIDTPPARHNINTDIQAARLIVIRRRKIKKHKLKKLRKKMKFEWAKVRQKREMRKEKLFQAELIAQIKEGEKFSAEQYVLDKIRQANEIPIPRFWKGKRLPQFIIKEKMGIK